MGISGAPPSKSGPGFITVIMMCHSTCSDDDITFLPVINVHVFKKKKHYFPPETICLLVPESSQLVLNRLIITKNCLSIYFEAEHV